MGEEYYLDEDRLAEFWSNNRQRFNGCFPLKDFLVWSREWVETCEKIKRIAEERRRNERGRD